MLVPDRQGTKVEMIRQFAPLVDTVRVATPPAIEPDQLRAPVEALRRRLRLAAGDRDERPRWPPGARRPGAARRASRAAGPADARGAGAAPTQLQGEMARDFAARLGSAPGEPRPIPGDGFGDVPAEVRRRYIGSRAGACLLRIHPAVDIWQEAGATRFVGDLRAVDPDVTGPPVTSFEAIRFIRRGYVQGTLYALVLVVAVTPAILRSPAGTALALAPLVPGRGVDRSV